MNALQEQDVVEGFFLLKRKAQAFKNHRTERNYQDLENQLTDEQSFLNYFSMERLKRNEQALDLQDQTRLPYLALTGERL